MPGDRNAGTMWYSVAGCKVSQQCLIGAALRAPHHGLGRYRCCSFSTGAFDPANTRLVFRSRSTPDIFATAALLQLCSSVSTRTNPGNPNTTS